MFRLPGRSRFASEHRGGEAAIAYIQAVRARAHVGDVTVEVTDILERADRVALLVSER